MASQNLPPEADVSSFSSAANPRNGSGKKNKRKRANQKEASSSSRKRIFSEEDDDDLVFLNGLVEFFDSHQGSEELDPLDMMDELYPFVKERLNGTFTKAQIKEKVREMKESYFQKKEKKEDNVFESPHDAEVFELSRKIWDASSSHDDDNENENGGDGEKEEGEKEKYVFLKDSLEIPKMLGMPGILDESMMKMLGPADAKELNRGWKELRMEEVRLYIQKLELLKEMTQKIVDGMKKED